MRDSSFVEGFRAVIWDARLGATRGFDPAEDQQEGQERACDALDEVVKIACHRPSHYHNATRKSTGRLLNGGPGLRKTHLKGLPQFDFKSR